MAHERDDEELEEKVGYPGEGAEHGLDEEYWNELPDEAQAAIRAAAAEQEAFEEQAQGDAGDDYHG